MKMTNDCASYIREKIATILSKDEKIISLIENCVLVQYPAKKGMSYRAVNIHNFSSKYICTKLKDLDNESYTKIYNKVISLDINCCYDEEKNSNPKDMLMNIFNEILPKYGFIIRENQKQLALQMLESLINNNTALCEAAVGTGKTHAYLISVIVYKIFSDNKFPAVISTSSIILQNELFNKILPQLSDILVENNIIDKPIKCVVKKGISHYICKKRLRNYLSQTNILSEEYFKNKIDLDSYNIPQKVKEKINIKKCSKNCNLCNMSIFKNSTDYSKYDFIITNHNYLISDFKNDKTIISSADIIVIDEAHKFYDCVKNMYLVSFYHYEIDNTINEILKKTKSDDKNLINLCSKIILENNKLFEEAERKVNTIDLSFNIINKLSEIKYYIGKIEKYNIKINPRKLYEIKEKLRLILYQKKSICWIESKNKICVINIIPKEINTLIDKNLWNENKKVILTSGTITNNLSFDYIKNLLSLSEEKNIKEVIYSNLFNYAENGLLYIPEDIPYPNYGSENYVTAIENKIIELVNLTFGHTLVLFTSYKFMNKIFKQVSRKINYPVFLMKKNNLNTIDEYKKSRNGVLFASGNIGEGINFDNDLLSSLVVVKLPFPKPEIYAKDDKDFINKSAVPYMSTMLRQWIGRGIRREEDKTVFSILDNRAGMNGKYHHHVISSLPEMKVTTRKDDIYRFIIENKNKEYFI